MNTTIQAALAVFLPLLLAVLAALALWAAKEWRAKKADAEGLADVAADAALRWADEMLEPVIFGLVTRAERELGGGVGRLKLATVLDQVLAVLPERVKIIVNSAWIIQRIEASLAKAKTLWAENPGLVDPASVAVQTVPLVTFTQKFTVAEDVTAGEHD
jgi:hypothetical protein